MKIKNRRGFAAGIITFYWVWQVSSFMLFQKNRDFYLIHTPDCILINEFE